jgi:hypothetical protein
MSALYGIEDVGSEGWLRLYGFGFIMMDLKWASDVLKLVYDGDTDQCSLVCS